MASAEGALPEHRRFHVSRLVVLALLIIAIGAAASLFGWDIGSWFSHIGDTIKAIPAGYLVAGLALTTVETVAAAFAWYSILRYAFADHEVRWHQILACYAAAVGLNCVLPANIGTLAMLVMFTAIIPAATFAAVVSGYVVQKVFFTFMGVLTYIYLFTTVSGSFSLQFGFVSEHPAAIVILLAAAVLLIALVARMLRARVAEWWDEAKQGGEIIAHPRVYFSRVALPEAISWLAMLGVIAVFLAAYHIPVTFDTLMRVIGGNSIANMTSVTPGGAGVQQGFNVISLKGVTSASNATAYSVAQQLVTTVWNLLLAIVLVVRAFGWSGGRELVEHSYTDARTKRAEQVEARRARREARLHARAHGALSDEGEA
jgi:hypothetical protein